jgi:hypothetical protein
MINDVRPERALLSSAEEVGGFTFADGIPAGLVTPVITPSRKNKPLFVPNDL